jgi:hypothetical protein
MPEPTTAVALGAIDNFIKIATQLTKLPKLAMPQYRDCAVDLSEIAQKLLSANENLSSWLYRFLYFDYKQQEARTRALQAIQEYRSMKVGPGYRQLKFSCHDLGLIYRRHISGKLVDWFTSKQKLEEAERIFTELNKSDGRMLDFLDDEVIGKLDQHVDGLEQLVDRGKLDEAEANRLAFKATMAPLSQHLERFSGELSGLVIEFAQIAKAPITLPH